MGTIVVATVLAVSSGVVMAAVAGARRTDTAVRRLNDYHRPGDAFLQSPDQAGIDAALHLPQVLDVGAASFISLSLAAQGAPARMTPFVAADDHMFRTFERLFFVHGSNPPPDRAFDVVVSEPMARHRRLRVGSRFDLFAYSAAQAHAAATTGQFDQGPPAGPHFTVTVSGISRVPTDIRDDAFDAVYLTPAFLSAYARGLGITEGEALSLWGEQGELVRLRRGSADFEPFAAAARPLLGPGGTVTGDTSDSTVAARAAQRSVHIQALALLSFGLLALVTTLLIVGQMIARSVAAAGRDDATLCALGMTRGQLVTATMAWCAILAGPAAVLAAALAVALSPLFPIGLARAAEMSPGLAVDSAVLGVGAVLTVALTLAAGALAAWRLIGRAPRRLATAPVARSRAVEAFRRLGLPAPVAVGVGLSVEPGAGERRAPVRGALASGVLAVAGVVAAATCTGSLGHLVHNPRRQGWNWDVLIGNANLSGDSAELAASVAANPGAGSVSGLTSLGPVDIQGTKVDVLAMVDVKGTVPPTILEGAPPAGHGEIALGSTTLRALGRHVGDTITVDGASGPVEMRIAGRVVMPIGGGWFGPDLGRGAVVDRDGAIRLASTPPEPQLFTVRYPADSDPAAALAGFRQQFPDLTDTGAVPQDIANLRRVAWMPRVLALLLVVVGGAATGHALLTAIRRRRKDLAVLKTLGFVRRQLAATVAWQATTFATVALAVGIPAGIVAGRLGWSVVADATGTFSPPVVSWVVVAVVVPAALAVANLLAAAPGWIAGNVQPARILRAE